MKELSIEEKAKLYDEAVEKAKMSYHTGDYDKDALEMLEIIFPELKESENIRIIKAIKYGLDHVFTNNTTVFEVTKEQCLAWLEKQGEQKPADIVKPKFKVGDRVIGIVSGMPYFITKVCDDHYNTESGCIIMFCAQDNFELYEQKPAWSEEDERNLNDAILFIKTGTYSLNKDNLINWLKSLRPQSQWKPSDEQMKALSAINVTGEISYAGQGQELINLYNDLKKLTE